MIRSALLPIDRLPTTSSSPSARAPSIVVIWSTRLGVSAVAFLVAIDWRPTATRIAWKTSAVAAIAVVSRERLTGTPAAMCSLIGGAPIPSRSSASGLMDIGMLWSARYSRSIGEM